MSPVRHIGDEEATESLYEQEFGKLLRVSPLWLRASWKGQICDALQKAYANEPNFVYKIATNVPIGEKLISSVSKASDLDWFGNTKKDGLPTPLANTPEDKINRQDLERAKELLDKLSSGIQIGPVAQENPRKRAILDLALQWGCDWAKTE